MDSVIATVSGYHGSERFKLIKLISQSGASYVGALNPSTTHLVCRKFEGKKYELARKFRIIVVNHRWIEECIKQGRLVYERPYMKQCGSVIGPLLLDIQADAETPVIDVESGDGDGDGDAGWTVSWLLKENLVPDVNQNMDRSNRSKRKLTKRCSRQEVPLTNEYGLDESPSFVFRNIESKVLSCPSPAHRMNQNRRTTTLCESSKRGRRLLHKNARNEVKTSSASDEDSLDKEMHHNNVDIGEPSQHFGRRESVKPNKNRSPDRAKRRTLILEDSEYIVDLGEEPACDDDESNEKENNPKLSTQVHLSCVICWTDFSSTRGVLPCGHRFCFSCIQNWADHMTSMKKNCTCPLCKASFCSIQKMEEAATSDQKIYSQTIPNNPSATDVYILPHGRASTHHVMPPPPPVCHHCDCREPEEFLIRCHSCDIRCVHSYCLDPPQNPWVCLQCKDLRMRFAR